MITWNDFFFDFKYSFYQLVRIMFRKQYSCINYFNECTTFGELKHLLKSFRYHSLSGGNIELLTWFYITFNVVLKFLNLTFDSNRYSWSNARDIYQSRKVQKNLHVYKKWTYPLNIIIKLGQYNLLKLSARAEVRICWNCTPPDVIFIEFKENSLWNNEYHFMWFILIRYLNTYFG